MLKSFPKILTIFFLTVFTLQIICLFSLLAAPVAAQALEFRPQVGIPGAEKGFGPGESYPFAKNDTTAPIAKYVRAIYNYGIGIIGILAAVVLMIGGVLWIIAGGNATQIGEAKAWIGAALTGLVLALTSYLILNTINPALVNLEITQIPGVSEMKTGCCTTRDGTTQEGVAQDNCKAPNTWQQGSCPKQNLLCGLPCCEIGDSSGPTGCSANKDNTQWMCEQAAKNSGKTFRQFLQSGSCVNNTCNTAPVGLPCCEIGDSSGPTGCSANKDNTQWMCEQAAKNSGKTFRQFLQSGSCVNNTCKACGG